MVNRICSLIQQKGPSHVMLSHRSASFHHVMRTVTVVSVIPGDSVRAKKLSHGSHCMARKVQPCSVTTTHYASIELFSRGLIFITGSSVIPYQSECICSRKGTVALSVSSPQAVKLLAGFSNDVYTFTHLVPS